MNVRLALLALAMCASACGGAARARAAAPGDAAAGREAIVRYACGACHQIAGVPAARGRVGPPLGGVADRAMIAGRLPTTPEDMARWIQHPQDIAPGVDMPEMGVSGEEARDITAYLYSLR